MEFNKKIISLILSSIFLFSNAQNYTDYVNPFIGTSNFGATNPCHYYPLGLDQDFYKLSAQ